MSGSKREKLLERINQKRSEASKLYKKQEKYAYINDKYGFCPSEITKMVIKDGGSKTIAYLKDGKEILLDLNLVEYLSD